MNTPPGSGNKPPSTPGLKAIPEENVADNVGRIVKSLRASTCKTLAEHMRQDRQVMAKIIKGLGSGSYTRDLTTAASKTERKNFLINEIDLIKQIDGPIMTEQKIRYFNVLIRRLVENECHNLARTLVEAILSRANTIEASSNGRVIGNMLPAIRKPRISVLDAVNNVLGPIFGAKKPTEQAPKPIFSDDESDDPPARKSTIPQVPPKKS